MVNYLSLLCRRHPTSSAKTLSFRAVRPPRSFVRPFVRPNRSCHHDKRLSNLDETYREYSLAHIDDVTRFWRSKVKVAAGRWGGEGIHVDARFWPYFHCTCTETATFELFFIISALRSIWRPQFPKRVMRYFIVWVTFAFVIIFRCKLMHIMLRRKVFL